MSSISRFDRAAGRAIQDPTGGRSRLVADYRKLSPAEVRRLRQCGEVTDWPVFKRHGKVRGYRYLARYLTKERSDGIIISVGQHPWSCSRSLLAKLPPPEVWLDESDRIEIPDGALFPRMRTGGSQFGSYRAASSATSRFLSVSPSFIFGISSSMAKIRLSSARV